MGCFFSGRTHETDVEQTNTPPGQETGSGSQTSKVVEDSTGVRLQTHVRQRAESSREKERDPRNTVLRGLGEDLGSLTVQGKTVESSRAGVQVGGGSRPSRSQETRVDDRRKSLDSGSLNSDDKGRLGSVGASETETRGVGRNEQTNDENLNRQSRSAS